MKTGLVGQISYVLKTSFELHLPNYEQYSYLLPFLYVESCYHVVVVRYSQHCVRTGCGLFNVTEVP